MSSNPDRDRRYKHDYYAYARSLGLCGRCKKADALPNMAYCLACRTAIQRYNHQRQGEPTRTYETKFSAVVRDYDALR